LREDLKGGVVSTQAPLNDSSRVSTAILEQLQRIAGKYGFRLNREEIGAAALPNGISSITCYSWLLMHFRSCGDEEPNFNEIHLDPTDEKSIHREYTADLQ
jgi:hypothetical protein